MVSHCQTGWYADQFSQNNDFYSPCIHRNVVVDTSGGMRFVDGEVTDDFLVRALCLDCGEYLTESGIHGAWRGESHPLEQNLELEGDYESE
jgi:hypothetical protein